MPVPPLQRGIESIVAELLRVHVLEAVLARPEVRRGLSPEAVERIRRDILDRLKASEEQGRDHRGEVNFWYAFAAATTLIFGAAYTLWMYKRVIFGAVTNHHVSELTDLNAREVLIMTILAVCVLGMGLYPLPFSDILHASVNDLLVHVAHSKLPL